jgi:hypothetical protein
MPPASRTHAPRAPSPPRLPPLGPQPRQAVEPVAESSEGAAWRVRLQALLDKARYNQAYAAVRDK